MNKNATRILLVAFLLLCLLALLVGCGPPKKPHVVTEVKEVVKYERVPVPETYLNPYCLDLSLSAVEDYGALEDAAIQLYLCNRQHNEDKQEIKKLK